jgi:uncharacterized protein YegP (UPF0339 family)
MFGLKKKEMPQVIKSLVSIRFETFKDKKGEWRVRMVSNNGRILMSSEGYSRKSSAIRVVNRIEEELTRCKL